MKTILLVDDDCDFLQQLEIQLKAHGYIVLTAGGHKQAEEILARTHPDAAIVDLMMEHEDSGFALSYRIKKMDPSIPVILVTNVANETGLSFGNRTPEEQSWLKADVVLTKPIRFEQLQPEMERLMKE